MILPQDSAHAAITIGNSKFAVFVGLAVVELENDQLESGILLRPAEINCITHKPGAEAPLDMSTAYMQPGLIDADSMEEVASIVTEQIMVLNQRILDKQAQEEAAAGAEKGCCGGHCHSEHSGESNEQPQIPADATA